MVGGETDMMKVVENRINNNIDWKVVNMHNTVLTGVEVINRVLPRVQVVEHSHPGWTGVWAPLSISFCEIESVFAISKNKSHKCE